MNLSRKHFLIIGLVAASSLTLGALTSYAESGSGSKCSQEWEHGAGWHHGQGRDGHYMQERLAKLDLTSQQHDQIKQIFDQQKPARKEKRHAMHDSFLALKKATKADAYDRNQVQQIANQQAKLQADLIVLRADTMHQVYAVLTPEQKQKWEDQRQKWEDHGGHKKPGNEG